MWLQMYDSIFTSTSTPYVNQAQYTSTLDVNWTQHFKKRLATYGD